MVSTRLGIYSPCNVDVGHNSRFSVTMIFSPGLLVAAPNDYGPGSELLTYMDRDSGSRCADDAVDFAGLGPENLIRLGEDFVRALPHRTPPGWRKEDLEWKRLISEVVSRVGTSPLGLSSQDVTLLETTVLQVSFFPRQTFPLPLKYLVVRSYSPPIRLIISRGTNRIHGSDFMFMPSFADLASSQTWYYAMNPWTTHL